MAELKLISPLLDNFAMGEAISDCGGIRVCPAMDQNTGDKYIVKVFSNPSNIAQLDAMVLSGAYADRTQALSYYKTVAKDILDESQLLNKLSELDGFLPCRGSQLVESEDESGYDVYTLTPYRMSLDRYWSKNEMTHLSVLNLGLDICSALAVCRRCGYLYVALTPENVYFADDKGFKLGDIGFIPLNSLKYASLPDRYRSAYTPPEIDDAFASINETLDVYAIGLILYQVFNGGILPDNSADELPAPEFADYEMAEIILKACAKNPGDRWSDPAQMGQALVDYMQRNGAHDTPIVPAKIEEPTTEEIADSHPSLDTTVESEESPIATQSDEAAEPETDDTELLIEAVSQTADVQITDEVSDMLNQADELISHETPAPVIPPEPIDVQLPIVEEETLEEIVEDSQETEVAEPEENEASSEETDTEAENNEVIEQEEATSTGDTDDDYIDYEPTRKNHWLRTTLIILALLSMLASGFVFYKFYYLQHIDSLTLTGEDFNLNVYVNTQADEALLNVVCYDTYGNQYNSPVVNGVATFKDLAPDCAYTVKISIDGFHSLTGQIAANYSTPKQTNIVQFSAITGAEDGSAILNFSVTGPDLNNWIIRRSAQDETTADFPCTEHTYTFTGLTIGKEYTFELLSAEGKQIIGTTKITHTASALISAENPLITSCQDGILTVVWSAPENATVSSWNIHCFNDKGYDKTISSGELSATFDGIITNDPYTIEITADGMSVSQRVYVPENAVTISNFAVTQADSTSITLGWKNGNNPSANGWILQYSIDGSPVKEVKTTNAESIKLTPYIPDSTCSFTLLTADSGDVIGGTLTYTTKKAGDFSGYTVKRSNMNFKMCLTPNVANWTYKNLRASDYTTTFKVNQKASFLVYINKTYSVSSNKIHVTYVIRDSEGTVVNFSTDEIKWANMWRGGYGEFDLPTLPKASGKYQVTVYFNDAIAGQQNFTMK